jgi:hypothetical protein
MEQPRAGTYKARRGIYALPLTLEASGTGWLSLVAFHMTSSAYNTAKCRVSRASGLVMKLQLTSL